MRRGGRWGLTGLIIAVGWLLLGGGAAAAAVPAPFRGTALWIRQVPEQIAPQSLAAQARSIGIRTLYVEAGAQDQADPQFTPALVQELRSGGVDVCAWTFVEGQDPTGEAAVAVAAARAGAQCLVIDAEGEYDGLYAAAHVFVQSLRRQLGAHYPIGLAGQAEVTEHPTFPYSVFLGPGGFDVDMPQIYWRDFHTSVDRAFQASVGINAIYGRPILPVGQLYGAPSAAALLRFRSLSAAYGFAGTSFFSLDASQPSGLAALASVAPRIARRRPTPPTLSSSADGDEIVWAQELLDAAGAHLPVGGFFGSDTAHAVASFQARHHLHVDGDLDPATWTLLERYTPAERSWSGGPPDSAQSGPTPVGGSAA